MKKLFVVFLCLVMVMVFLPTMAFAGTTGRIVEIDTVDELSDAIKNQQANDTWMIAAGTYTLTQADLDKYKDVKPGTNGEGDWYFPIYESGIKIIGQGEVVITSDVERANGAWSSQDFISIWADGVTIENINFSCKKEVNKVIEIMAKDCTLRDVLCLPVEDGDGKVFSGSIYVNTQDAGNTVLEDVTLSAWINARAVKEGTVTAKNVTQDFVKNSYAGYSTPGDGYAWNPGISGDKVILDGFTVKVDNSVEFNKQIIDNLKPGTTVVLTEDIEVSEAIVIEASDVTIEGNGHKILASENYIKNSNNNLNNVINVEEADNVTLRNVNVKAGANNNHVLNLYKSENVVLENVALDHEDAYRGAPMIANTSTVTVKGEFKVITGDNSWYGINIDNRYGEAELTFDEDATLEFQDKSAGKNQDLIRVENSGTAIPDGKLPTVINKSENILLDVSEDGTTNLHEHAAIHVASKAATTTEDGNIEYWYCEGCDKYFSDEDLTKEITLQDTIISKLTENRKDTETPKTEDLNSILPWIAVMLIASVGTGATFIYKKREER